MAHDPGFDATRNLLELGDRRLVFHCHHFNTFLQRSLEDMFGEMAFGMQVEAAAESARHLLGKVFEADAHPAARLRTAAEIFAENGFGQADLSELGPYGGIVTLPTSHYAIAWRSKVGEAKRPVCFFAAGFWAGAVAAASGFSPERVVATEEHCAAVGAAPCRIRVEVR